MKILIACEESQVVCKAFRAKGHEAFSCDILPAGGGHPEWHLQADVREYLYRGWDMIIAFPPCTDICVSGARWFPEKIRDGRQARAVDFFNLFANHSWKFPAHSCPKIAIENPIGIMSRLYRKPDQIIQPWQFGHGETKATCLWLKGLPLLNPTNIVSGRSARIHRMPPSPERAMLRSKTFEGVAQAMADQWAPTVEVLEVSRVSFPEVPKTVAPAILEDM